jgi:hypothetical protein
MHYTCDEINRILRSDHDSQIDEDAFLEHVEHCPSCRKLGVLDDDAEKKLITYLTVLAPSSISRRVMQLIRRDQGSTSRTVSTGPIRTLLLGAIYIFIGIIGFVNYDSILAGMSSSLRELYRIPDKIGNISLVWRSFAGFADKVALTPPVMAILIGCITLAWMLSFIRFREITK